jgi:nitrogen fixation protein NifZ
MTELTIPKYQWGQRVQAAADLFNDGTYPDQLPESLLAGVGEVGEIVQIGRHVETNTIIYLVEFKSYRVVGCLEEEIAPLQETVSVVQQENCEPA